MFYIGCTGKIKKECTYDFHSFEMSFEMKPWRAYVKLTRKDYQCCPPYWTFPVMMSLRLLEPALFCSGIFKIMKWLFQEHVYVDDNFISSGNIVQSELNNWGYKAKSPPFTASIPYFLPLPYLVNHIYTLYCTRASLYLLACCCHSEWGSPSWK